jgi:hypothetical protein
MADKFFTWLISQCGKLKIIGSADKFATLAEKHCRMADIRLILADITMPGSLK